MAVSGCGKSTIAARLAAALNCKLIEGDDFHLPQSKRKTRQGLALDDDDRWPWLDRLGMLLAGAPGNGQRSGSAIEPSPRTVRHMRGSSSEVPTSA